MEKWSFQRIRELMTPIALRGMAGNKIGCARISMMVRSISSNTRPDTLMQDRTLQAYRFLLQRTAGPYIGVKLRSHGSEMPRPGYLRQRTYLRSVATAVEGHKPPYSVQQIWSLLDHLVGGDQQRVRDGQTERPGSFHVDDQLKFSGLDDREVRWVLAFENAAGVGADLLIDLGNACSVARQPTSFGELTRKI